MIINPYPSTSLEAAGLYKAEVIRELAQPQSTEDHEDLVTRAAREVPLSQLLALSSDERQGTWLLTGVCEALGIAERADRESEVLRALTRLARHTDASVRYAVAEALGKMGASPEVREVLGRLLEDENSAVRVAARESIEG